MKPHERADGVTAGSDGPVPIKGDRLRASARKAIQSGSLPNRRAERMWGGAGAGSTCPICGVPVKPDEIELEIEFSREDGAADNYHVHPPCFAVWDAERSNLEAASTTTGVQGAASSRGAAVSFPLPEAADDGNGSSRGRSRAESSGTE
jgi:hypothetical protein